MCEKMGHLGCQTTGYSRAGHHSPCRGVCLQEDNFRDTEETMETLQEKDAVRFSSRGYRWESFFTETCQQFVEIF